MPTPFASTRSAVDAAASTIVPTPPDDHIPELDGIALVRWPTQQRARAQLANARRPRLLFVEQGADPPLDSDDVEDWTRAEPGTAEADARLAALHRRVRAFGAADEVHLVDRRLTRRDRSLDLTVTQRVVMATLLRQPGVPVARATVLAALTQAGARTSAPSLRSMLTRLDRRVAPLDLQISLLTSDAVLLEVAPEGSR
jgi:hypothetical protein